MKYYELRLKCDTIQSQIFIFNIKSEYNTSIAIQYVDYIRYFFVPSVNMFVLAHVQYRISQQHRNRKTNMSPTTF